MNTTEPAVATTPLPMHPLYGKPIAFTWVPNPKNYNSTCPCVQYLQLLNGVFRFRPLTRTLSRYEFYPELTDEGNIHIHGVYYIKNMHMYHRWFLPACKKWGFIKIKSRDINSAWTDYVRKSAFMKDVVDVDLAGQTLPYPINRKTLRAFIPINEFRYMRNTIRNSEKGRIRRTRITDFM